MYYRQTPPIQFFPVFEAAARHLSFKKAAEELCVTAPAVGQQIRTFEHWLGKPLFQRHIRQLSLTPEGEYFLQVAQGIMKLHRQGYLEYQRRFKTSSIHISAPLFLSQELLMPHYLTFKDFVPGTELRIESRMSYVDFDTEPVDAAIRFGDGDWPGLDCRRLCHVSFAAVCSRRYAEEFSLTRSEELPLHRLIFSSPALQDWTIFPGDLAEQAREKIVCDSYMAALKAAADGLGVAVAILPTANAWVNDGRLVLPFTLQIPSERGYWMVAPKRGSPADAIEGFYRWLLHLFAGLPALETPPDLQTPLVSGENR